MSDKCLQTPRYTSKFSPKISDTLLAFSMHCLLYKVSILSFYYTSSFSFFNKPSNSVSRFYLQLTPHLLNPWFRGVCLKKQFLAKGNPHYTGFSTHLKLSFLCWCSGNLVSKQDWQKSKSGHSSQWYLFPTMGYTLQPSHMCLLWIALFSVLFSF